MMTKFRSAGLVWPTLITIAMFAFLLGLGTWQMQRKAWKDGLVAKIEAKMGAQPLDLGQFLARMMETAPAKDGYLGGAVLNDLEYSPVRAAGTFDHALERYYYAPDPRLGPGYHVFTPLMLTGREGSGIAVMINRGFVPDEKKDPRTRIEGNPVGSVEVTGLLRVGGRKGAFTPDNDPRKNIWFWPDLAAMSGRMPFDGIAADVTAAAKKPVARDDAVLPFFLDALTEPANPGGLPKGGMTNLSIPNRHLEYALTWYGLAGTLVGVYLAFTISRLCAIKTSV
jgi:surfeit locus 1 family protein